MEDKALGLRTLGSMAAALEHEFLPYLERTAALMVPCINYKLSEGVRSAAVDHMVSLLAAIRDMPTNGYMLWSAASHVSIGREPSPPVALAMATRIVAACSTAWPATAKAFLTPERIVEHLARDKHGDLAWQKIQAQAYGTAIMCAKPSKGVIEFLRLCARNKLVMIPTTPGAREMPPNGYYGFQPPVDDNA